MSKVIAAEYLTPDRMNSLPKFVASKTLTTTDWNARIIRGDVAAEVARLKQETGHNLLIYGSGQLVEFLRPHHLIDEYHLMVHPLVLGSGKRLFASEIPANFQLVSTYSTRTGVLILTYQSSSAA